VIDRLVDAGASVDKCCRILGVALQSHHKHKRTPDHIHATATPMPHRPDPRGTRRLTRHLRRPPSPRRTDHVDGVQVSPRTVSLLMAHPHIYGPARSGASQATTRSRDIRRPGEQEVPSPAFQRGLGHRHHPTSNPRRLLYCAAVLDAFSRRNEGWSIDSRQDSTLVVNALDMAIRNRRPPPGGIAHADHGTQFPFWPFSERIRSAD
jgi:putative transposase